MSISYNTIAVETSEQRYAVITMNRQISRNALNREMRKELQEALTKLENNDQIRAIVITGYDTFFVAGADVKEMAGLTAEGALMIAGEMKDLTDQIIFSKKPVIAAINGACFGGGLELALACDIRIANRDAQFGFPEVKLGIIPGGGGTQRLLDIAGNAVASYYILSGDSFSAERAFQLNLISSISNDAKQEAIDLATRLSQSSQTAISCAKRVLNMLYNRNLEERLQFEMEQFHLLFNLPDSHEGMRAFIEKRKPNFQ